MMNNLKLFGLVLILLAGCTTKPAPETEQQIAIVTTTGMIADAARNVAGEQIMFKTVNGVYMVYIWL
ncbi:MAG: hypothetical protein ACKOYP_14100 [Bacteroidota bacterium]